MPASQTSPFPTLESKQSDKRCTNCSSIMSLYQLPAHYGQSIDIDVCLDCNAIWFDQWESSQLSPDGVVALFQLINERGGTSSSASTKLNEGLRCVSCGDSMKLVNDRVKNTRFVYQSCRQGHGRLTTFYNFLSEKQFVRELTKAERAKLCATVRQVKCSGCGAPVDLTKADACQYCRAPVSVFDRDAAKQAIDHYLRERKRHIPSAPPQNYGYSQRQHQRDWDTWDTIYAADIATDLLWALGRAASRGLGRAAPAGAVGAGAGAVLADSGGALTDAASSAATGGLLSGANVLTSSGAPLASATDALFGAVDSGGAGMLVADSAAQMLGSATDALPSAINELPSATDALFGGGGASDLFSNAGRAAGDFAGSVTDSLSSTASDAFSGVADSAADSFGDVASDTLGEIGASAGDFASSAGDGVVDLVSDGIGSLIGSIFS